MKFHSAFERCVSRVIYKTDWATSRPAIMRHNGWKKCSSEVMIRRVPTQTSHFKTHHSHYNRVCTARRVDLARRLGATHILNHAPTRGLGFSHTVLDGLAAALLVLWIAPKVVICFFNCFLRAGLFWATLWIDDSRCLYPGFCHSARALAMQPLSAGPAPPCAALPSSVRASRSASARRLSCSVSCTPRHHNVHPASN